MKVETPMLSSRELNDRLATSGLRLTAQRQEVLAVVLERRDHPTAEEVFIRAKRRMPEISMATVYNCLDALVKCGLVRLVNLDRGAARYCPNMAAHSHFRCEACGRIYDIELSIRALTPHLPVGFQVNHSEVSLHGLCAACATSHTSTHLRSK
jgi:Fur family transcriptional regulator, peroxide stress response regulator